MKRLFTKIFTVFSVLSIMAINQSNINTKSCSSLVLANIDALANNEGGGAHSYDIYEETTDHKMNNVVYKQSKVIDCHEGGQNSCTSGKYYRLKKSDGTWDKWTPA